MISFQDHNIAVYGTWEDPLLKPLIEEILGIRDIRSTLRNLDEGDRNTMPVIDSLGRLQETTLLTESGLYELLFVSRKPLAKELGRHVLNYNSMKNMKPGDQRSTLVPDSNNHVQESTLLTESGLYKVL
jgi:prophage antirepressor-like protein